MKNPKRPTGESTAALRSTAVFGVRCLLWLGRFCLRILACKIAKLFNLLLGEGWSSGKLVLQIRYLLLVVGLHLRYLRAVVGLHLRYLRAVADLCLCRLLFGAKCAAFKAKHLALVCYLVQHRVRRTLLFHSYKLVIMCGWQPKL